jgi:polyhydroxyalkanoate synthase subunit PhaC
MPRGASPAMLAGSRPKPQIAMPRPRDTKAQRPKAQARATDLDAQPPEITRDAGLSVADRYSTKSLDRAAHAHLARFTLGISPFGLSATFFAWWLHLMGAPGKQTQLIEKAARKAMRLAVHAGEVLRDPDTPPCIAPLPHDRRFDHESWRRWPYTMIYQSFLLTQQWWYNAARDIDGLSAREEQVVSFVSRQMLDTVSPANFVMTNPEVAAATWREGGANLARGMQHFLEDWERAISGKGPVGTEDFRPGRDVAITEGQVVLREHLFELIQYAPKTKTVHPEPVLIVPAWIMKYYILDLSPQNSLVRHLVGQGFTVFMISWRNPTAQDRDLDLADYLAAADAAMAAVQAIVPGRQLHATGYCLGGTLLAAKAAQMARDGDGRLASLTLLATQTDHEDPGELQLFISESEIAFLEDMMWDQGYLDTKQMAGAFQLLRSTDLIWSRYVHEYLMGRRQPMFDLMAWNADATRMPYRMHSAYLRQIFLDNELAEGKFVVGSRPVSIGDIAVPIFCVATTTDHVAPWRSVYRLHHLAETAITFVLTTGGHNAGIISRPGDPDRAYHVATTPKGAPYQPPEAWIAQAQPHAGSWWPEWVAWLEALSQPRTAPPGLGTAKGPYRAIAPAPGSYVFQR